MLAQPADDIEDAMTRLPMAALEWKLDGARVQVHKDGDDVRIYSRTGNDVTAAAPEVVEAVRALSARALILDGEVIALKQDGAPHAFQDTMSRFGRVQDIASMRARMPLSPYFFDCLRRDDEDLLAAPARALRGADGRAAARARDPASGDERRGRGPVVLRRRHWAGHEGIMVKALDLPYDPGARSAAGSR
jgi:DNA ligase-1